MHVKRILWKGLFDFTYCMQKNNISYTARISKEQKKASDADRKNYICSWHWTSYHLLP